MDEESQLVINQAAETLVRLRFSDKPEVKSQPSSSSTVDLPVIMTQPAPTNVLQLGDYLRIQKHMQETTQLYQALAAGGAGLVTPTPNSPRNIYDEALTLELMELAAAYRRLEAEKVAAGVPNDQQQQQTTEELLMLARTRLALAAASQGNTLTFASGIQEPHVSGATIIDEEATSAAPVAASGPNNSTNKSSEPVLSKNVSIKVEKDAKISGPTKKSEKKSKGKKTTSKQLEKEKKTGGGGKRKAPGMPRHPINAYNAFFVQEGKRIRDTETEAEAKAAADAAETGEEPVKVNKLSRADVTRVIAQRWNQLSPTERAPFKEMAAKDKVRYDREMAIFRNKELGTDVPTVIVVDEAKQDSGSTGSSDAAPQRKKKTKRARVEEDSTVSSAQLETSSS